MSLTAKTFRLIVICVALVPMLCTTNSCAQTSTKTTVQKLLNPFSNPTANKAYQAWLVYGLAHSIWSIHNYFNGQQCAMVDNFLDQYPPWSGIWKPAYVCYEIGGTTIACAIGGLISGGIITGVSNLRK